MSGQPCFSHGGLLQGLTWKDMGADLPELGGLSGLSTCGRLILPQCLTRLWSHLREEGLHIATVDKAVGKWQLLAG